MKNPVPASVRGRVPIAGLVRTLVHGRLVLLSLCVGGFLVPSPPAAAQMVTGSYVGNGTTGRTIAGLGFRPDVVLIKGYDFDPGLTLTSAVLRTSTMTGDNTKPLVLDNALNPNLIQSFTTDGFTIGSGRQVNQSGISFFWVAFKATPDLKVGTYTGDGTASHPITGLGFSPEYVIVMSAGAARAIHTASTAPAPRSFEFDSAAKYLNQITALGADGFTVNHAGAQPYVNASGVTYHYVAWNEVPGKVKVGSYNGTGLGPNVITGVGFQPEYLIVKSIYNDNAPSNVTPPGHQRFSPMAFDNDIDFARGVVGNHIQSFVSDGFQLGAAGTVNRTYNQCNTDGPGCTYFYVAFNAVCPDCPPLTTAQGAGTVTVTAANSFEMRFNTATGGGIDQFYDLAEDQTRTNDLAGGTSAIAWPLGIGKSLFSNSLQDPGNNNYYDVHQDNAGKLDLLEATATRVRVRQEAFYVQEFNTAILPGVKSTGDYSVYASGRVALRWNQRSTLAAGYVYKSASLDVNVHDNGLSPLNFTPYAQTGAVPATCTSGTNCNFALTQKEVAGVRTDFLTILHKDWSIANGYLQNVDTLGFNNDSANERGDFFWSETTGGTLAPGPGQSWSLLTYFKPTSFVNNADAAVTSRSADYRAPEVLSAFTAGGGWFGASENTSAVGPDFFNEAEDAYALTLNPATGLSFDINGGTTIRYHPFFKIRQWRSVGAPSTLNLKGVTLTKDVDFKADVKPVARAHFANQILFHTTLQDNSTSLTAPDVGTNATSLGVITVPGRYGNGAQLPAGNNYVEFQTLDFDKAKGAVEFWYQPNYVSNDAADHYLAGFRTNPNNIFFLEKAPDNNLYFTIVAGGTTSTYTVAAANFSWRASDWVHLRMEWDDSVACTPACVGQQRILINGVEPPHTDSTVDYVSANLTPAAYFRVGSYANGNPNGTGIYDEIYSYGGSSTTPAPLANGGLVSANEYLADGTRNFPLAFAGVNATTRAGQYFYVGTDSQFRGLNVGLATAGAGVAGGALEWEYWDGTQWANLETAGVGFTDSTNSFTKNGNVYWTADPPTWSVYSVNGGPDLFYVRVHLAAGATYATAPVESIITTDILLLQYCGDITLNNQTFAILAPIPTAVMLQSFEAQGAGGAVDLTWTTASELSNLGFHLYRANSEGGPYARITSSLIPGLGSSPTGQNYAYRDAGLVNGRTYYYELEDVETTGRTERHGPVFATPIASPGTSLPSGSPGPAGTSYGDPYSVVLREVERSPNHVVLELRTGGFFASPAEEGRVRLRIPGFGSASRPGEPNLPMRRVFVEAASGRKVRLASVLASDELRFRGLRPVSEGMPGIEANEEGIVLPSEEKRRDGPRFGELFPEQQALLLGVAFQDETKKAEVLVFPLRWDGDGLLLSRRLLVRLEFTGVEERETSRGGSQGRRRVERRNRASSGVVAKMVVRERGLYRVDFEDLFVAPGGRRGRDVPVSSLRLSRQGEGVAFHVEPAGATFGLGSSLYFLSEGSSLNPYGDAVYELETSGGGLQMEVDAPRSASGTVSEYFQDVRLEENHYYQAGLLEAPDLWLWDIVVSPGSKSYSFTVEGLASSSSAGRLTVVLQGASDFEGVPDHHVRVRVNGTLVGETTWDGKRPKSLELELEPGVLHEGTNALELEDVGDSGAAYSMVFLNRFSVSYPRQLVAVQGALEGRFERTGQAEIAAASAASVVIDTTGTPRWRTGASATPSGLRVGVEEGRSYLVTSNVVRPAVKRLSPSRLKTHANRADYLLLAPQAFLTAAQPLLDLRESQGLVTRAVSLEEVYDQFGHGEISPEAIKEFLEYAYHSWRLPSVRYVLLLGDASYDPKDYLGTGVKDWLPGFPVRTSYLWTVSDPAYASVNGEDLLPDIAIGRLPAGSVDEAQRLVQKIIGYENGGGSLDGSAVLVADDSDLAGNFEADADEIASTVLASRNPKKIYYSQQGSSTRTQIEDAFDAGASLMSYVGHGGTAVWASENIFNYRDVQNLAPQPQQPLLLTMNCLNGFFHFPPLNSLSEELLKAEGKGAIAAFSPSGLSVNDSAHLFHKALLQEIVSGRHERIGDAILAAQEAYAGTGAFPELLSIYNLLGDPALRIR